MIRFAFFSVGLVAFAAAMSGCCGPLGCGPGCGTVCNDCDGGCVGGPLAGGPLSAIRNMRQGVICGSGCGEAYIGEWISTPPDCQDPCCGNQFVGGARKARPFCFQRPQILRSLYGKRFCTGAESSASCGCGDVACGGCDAGFVDGGCGCDSCGGGEYVDSVYSDSVGEAVAPGPVQGGCGCASCRGTSPMASRLASMGRHPTGDSITARAKMTTQRAQAIRR